MPVTAALALLLAQQKQPARIDSITGKVVIHADFESKILGNKRAIRVYLPPNYEGGKDRYPVLYLADGQNVFSGLTSYIPNQEWKADESAEALIKANVIRPIIIVGVDNAGADRDKEYLPTKFKPMRNEFGGKADQFEKFLIDEVMPYINKQYRTQLGAQSTSIAGSSFGGIISYYLGMKRPDIFGKLGIFSPSLWINNGEAFTWLKRRTGQQIWLDIGTSEGTDMVRQTQKLSDMFVDKGWKPGKDLIYYQDGFAAHNEESWARRFPVMLTFFYRK